MYECPLFLCKSLYDAYPDILCAQNTKCMLVLYSRNKISMYHVMKHHDKDIKTNSKCRLISIFLCPVICICAPGKNSVTMMVWYCVWNASTKSIIWETTISWSCWLGHWMTLRSWLYVKNHRNHQGSVSLLMMWIRNDNMK